MGKSTYVMGGGRNKRTSGYDGGGGDQMFAILVCTY